MTWEMEIYDGSIVYSEFAFCIAPEGYEKLAQARQGKSFESMQPKPDNIFNEDFLPSGSTATAGGHYMHNAHVASSNSYNTATKSDDAFDTFGEDDENIAANLASNGVITTAAVWAVIMIHHLDCICHASSGQWYSYNDELGIYQEVPQATPDAS